MITNKRYILKIIKLGATRIDNDYVSLFESYLSDLPKDTGTFSSRHTMYNFVDDTTISANVDYRSAPGALNQVLQADVGKVVQWTPDNKMVLNESKTKTILALANVYIRR